MLHTLGFINIRRIFKNKNRKHIMFLTLLNTKIRPVNVLHRANPCILRGQNGRGQN